ncbi:MAG: ankyrin repeat domain-containing protein [Bacteroidota bacterium]|nr:ankyrin repeat domain-containing protein [Bacteroidota bacterium]
MKKKDIKAFFDAIGKNNVHEVKELVFANSQYLTTTNFAPPKKDDGQSGLQVAFKTGNFDIAQFLIDEGADIDFIDSSSINDWSAPVLHDSIRATIFNSFTVQKDTSKFDKAFLLLQLMLNKKANPNSVDSYGNNCLHRAIMDSKQMIDNPTADLNNGILLGQIRNVFQTLISAGADIDSSNESRPSAVNMVANFRLEQFHLW